MKKIIGFLSLSFFLFLFTSTSDATTYTYTGASYNYNDGNVDILGNNLSGVFTFSNNITDTYTGDVDFSDLLSAKLVSGSSVMTDMNSIWDMHMTNGNVDSWYIGGSIIEYKVPAEGSTNYLDSWSEIYTYKAESGDDGYDQALSDVWYFEDVEGADFFKVEYQSKANGLPGTWSRVNSESVPEP
jgi:hypothetical protein